MADAATCASCAAPLINPQRCCACGALQPPDPRRDHFATLALPRTQALDLALLEQRVVEFGRELHPDRVAGDGRAGPDAAAARTRAVLGAAQVNEAYAVLRDDYRRAEYLLALEGGPSGSADKAVPKGFLEQMLDERMELEEVLAGDAAGIERAAGRFEARVAECAADVAARFAALPAAEAPTRGAALAELRAALNVMAYYRGMLRDLRAALREKE